MKNKEKFAKEIVEITVWTGFNWSSLNAFCHLFKFIKWEDEEPYNIKCLLENSEVIR